MPLLQAKLIDKKKLTHDVLELKYCVPGITEMKPGQFVTFILPGIGGRSYSILNQLGEEIILIIKKWPIESGGRGGSIILCEAKIGNTYKCVGPAGHFVLQENIKNKLFIGTGTGLVPLYNMILKGLEKKTGEKYQLVFGVRYHTDMFYLESFEELKKLYPDNFYYHLVVSREEGAGIIKQGYVTDFLSKNVIEQYGEYYLCGAPAMIESCQQKLHDLGVSDDAVFFEKYS